MVSCLRSTANTVVVMFVGALTMACGTVGDTNSSGLGVDRTSHDTCDRFDSFAGQLRLGEPPAKPTELGVELGVDRPLEPGEVLFPVTRPVLESIELDRMMSGDALSVTVSGDGAFGWSVRFVQIPFLRGTDAPVPVSGSCILQLDVSGVDSGEAWDHGDAPLRLSPESDASAVVEVLSYPSSANIAQAYIGTRTSTPAVTVEASPDTGVITVAIDSAAG